MPFLTLEDPNAKIRGSRDPLGIVPIWSHLGRRIIANLTTASTSTRGFTIVLLARYFTELLLHEDRLPREDALDAFLRTEQMGAYVRHRAHKVDGDIRGIERVKAHVSGSGGKVHIGTTRAELILSDQKVYGLWGLYSVPARVSGFIADGPTGLTPNSSTTLPSIAHAPPFLWKEGAMSRPRPCRICREWFRPHPRAGDRQQVCGSGSCQKERHRRACANWHRRNPGYDEEGRFRRRLQRELPAFADPWTRPALAGMDLDLARDAVGLQVVVVVEEAARLLWSGMRDAVTLQPVAALPSTRKVLPRAARDDIANRSP